MVAVHKENIYVRIKGQICPHFPGTLVSLWNIPHLSPDYNARDSRERECQLDVFGR